MKYEHDLVHIGACSYGMLLLLMKSIFSTETYNSSE